LKSISTIGKAKEHVRINVEDEAGNTQGILWWSGAGEDLPEGDSKFDIAYSMRASTFRGQKQVTLQFEEFRITEEKPVEIREREIEIRDWRLETGKLKELENVLIWAEGADKAKGRSRFDLQQVDELVIYTTPPSFTDLRSVLEIVKPKKIFVFGVSPAAQKADEFLSQLAGMTKYVINNKAGKVSIKELVVATAQRESVIRIGLEWLAAGGHIAVSEHQYVQKELYVAVKGILEETAAYREYFSRANIEALIVGA
jgi:hypothetical protein